MAVINDWVQEAAEEITTKLLHPATTDQHVIDVAAVAGIIARHCPFEPGRAYSEVEYDPSTRKIVRRP